MVKLVQAETDATRLHQTIIRYTEIARALGPEGVRSKMLADGMRKLNGGLAVVAKSSGWPLTTVGEGTCAVFVGDRPVALCSESERWRAQASIQMTLGAITGSKAVVLDRGDILDASNRAGLVAAVQARFVKRLNMAVLLCSTGTPQPDAPWTAGQHRPGRGGRYEQIERHASDGRSARNARYAMTQTLFMHSVNGLANICKCAACEGMPAPLSPKERWYLHDGNGAIPDCPFRDVQPGVAANGHIGNR